MLVFIDESGDPGRAFDRGSSRFFVVTAVTFQDKDSAAACEKRIEKLHTELGHRGEFRFAKCSNKIRSGFLRGIATSDFGYRSVAVDKSTLDAEVMRGMSVFHQYIVALALDLWREHLPGAHVDVDRGGGESFSRALCKYVSKSFRDGDGKPLLKRVRTVNSRSSNLMQLTDMICGAVARSFERNVDEFRKLVQKREMEIALRP